MLKHESSFNFCERIALKDTLFKIKKGFTLAEVLITLGIIGIVAAMTIPNLMLKIEGKRTATKLRAFQSIMSQAIRMSEDEYGDIGSWGLGWNEASVKLMAERLKPFMKIAVDCGTSDTKGLCVPVSQYKHLDGSIDANSKSYRTDKRTYKFVMLNGTSVWFATPITADNQYQTIAWFYVDVNGKAMPNVIGRDLYMFEYRDGGFYPGGAPDSLYKKCGLPKSGWGCAYVVLQNQNINHIRKK